MTALEISRLLMDEYCERILVGTATKAKSAAQISTENNIPLTTCYKKIRLLKEMGFMKCVETYIDGSGKSIGLFKSELKKANIYYKNGMIKVRFEFHSGKVKEFEKDLETFR
jgi:hypothetical protein